MSGSGGGGGYEYQARATAYVGTHILAQEPLYWIEHSTPDIPISVEEETNGPGDDLKITLKDDTVIELQAKHGLKKGKEFWKAILKLAHGLAEKSSLYGILLTDSTASGPIKDKLRQDLKRLGQGRTDDLKDITQEVRKKFAEEGISNDSELFRRLRIIVIDLDDDSQGARNAQLLLSKIIEDQYQTGTAWETLVKDGLNLITNRGRREAASLARLLTNKSIPLSSTSSNPAVIAEGYREWLSQKTAHLKVPGFPLQRELSIEINWIPLQAKLREGDQTSFDAEFIPELYRLSVLIGAPGTGKSTLLRRLAHCLSSAGKRVIFIRLPDVKKLLDSERSEGFEWAILKAAADNAGFNDKELRLALSTSDYLLADGLDECKSDRANIADKLDAWVKAHSSTKVVITTRPSYESGILPGWQHIELSPLNKPDIWKYSKQLLAAYCEDTAKVQERLDSLHRQLQDSTNASLAVQNPLLLGFIVQLIAEDVEIGQNRTQLYNNIIKLASKRSPLDRNPIEFRERDAQRIFEIAGWKLLHKPGLTADELINSIIEELELRGYTLREAEEKAELGVEFWQNRCIFERYSLGTQDIISFVHPTLCEYAAGRYASRLSDEKLSQWLERVRRKPEWRESILFCAGSGAAERIITHLLELDNPEDPTSTEALLAAATLVEITDAPPKLIEAVANQILPRLTSPISDVVFEAAEALLALTDFAPDTIGTIAKSWFNHDQSWTQLAATRLALECGDDYVDLDTLKEVIDNIIAEPAQVPPNPRLPWVTKPKGWEKYGKNEWKFQEQVLIQGFKLLLQQPSSFKTARQMEELISTSNFGITWGGRRELESILHELVLGQIKTQKNVEQWEELALKLIKPILNFIKQNNVESIQRNSWQELNNLKQRINADQAILEAVIRATNTTSEQQDLSPNNKVSLGLLIRGMDWEKLSESDWDIMSNRQDIKAVDAVFKGMIAVLEIDPQRLVTEAKLVLENIKAASTYDLDAIEKALQTKEKIDSNYQEVQWAVEQIYNLRKENISLFSEIPVVPIKFRWERAKEVDISSDDLLLALEHPSQGIVNNARELLRHGAGGGDFKV